MIARYMYPTYNITPTKRIVNIMQTILKHQNMQQNKIKKLVNAILSQNYFNCNNDCYQQEEELAMDAPSSAVLSKIFFIIHGM
jgi:hypothetical protein